MAATLEKTSFDPEYLKTVRERYAAEAAKRLKPEGSSQYIQLSLASSQRLHSLSEDPWVDHDALNTRSSPIENNETYRFFVLGAGFGGLQYAVRLIDDGIATANEIRFADAAGGFGGTWYWNRFPGLHCDLESYIYLPLLEETGYVPAQKYAPGAEIRAHAERIAERWGLEDNALFRTDVNVVTWDEKDELWVIEAVEGRGPGQEAVRRTFRAQYLYLAAGVLTRPQVPDIPGLLDFKGDMFHTARWNYAVSGGSQEDQQLVGLEGKKVAVVGTAATAIGTIPEVAKYAGELYVIQRTPAYVKPRGQRPTDGKEFAGEIAAETGWQWQRQLNFNSFLTNSPEPGARNLVGDAWTDMPAYSALLGSPKHGVVDPSSKNLEKHVNEFHALDLPHMESIRARIDQIVTDKETAERLKPWYPSWCKRPTFSDGYLQAFNRPNVHLVDTDGKGPSRITENAIVVGEKEYPVDVIIFGTGYSVSTPSGGSPAARVGVEIIGRNGLSLDEKWAKRGAATLHGYAVHGFPNLWFSGTNQATITGNNVFMLRLIAQHITHWIAEAEKRVGPEKRAIIEVTKDAEEEHTAEVFKRAPYYATLAGCTPGYFNGHGDVAKITDPAAKERREKGVAWSEGTISFLKLIEKWRGEGQLKGLDVRAANPRDSSKL